jgi:MFS family permease
MAASSTVQVGTNSARRVLGAAMAGTAVEFYDFYIFGTAAALVFGPYFFPGNDPSVQLLQAYLTFAIAFVARPLGALAFGHFGDRIGRKSTLVASLTIMGLSTFLIAFLPGYAQAGWIAPLLLCILRFGQGFGLGGEWGGAALLAVENAPANKRARYGMFPQLGAPIGYIASNGLFLLLSVALTDAQFNSWGWRIPFLASIILIGIGLWVRLKLTETPAFAAAIEQAPPAKIPLLELLRTHPRALIGGTCAAVLCFSLFYFCTWFCHNKNGNGPHRISVGTVVRHRFSGNWHFDVGLALR